MPVTYLELENFKSYAGLQRIGPFTNFTSVIGPNGSGKSNLMDAISFILGVQSRDLRSSQMRDLIFRPPDTQDEEKEDVDDNTDDEHDNDDDINTSKASTSTSKSKRSSTKSSSNLQASASLIYQDAETLEETRFSRLISSKGVGEYQINNRTVSFTTYESKLASINVLNSKSGGVRNFLVFQGDVESTARKTDKELVQWFEDISQSAELKGEYEEKFKKMQDADVAARFASKKQKGFREKKRQLKNQKEEAERFDALLESKSKLHTEFFLWQLFHIQTDTREKEEVLSDLEKELEEADKLENAKGEELREAKKEASTARRATAKLEKTRVNLAAEVDKIQPTIIQTAEEIKNLTKKVGRNQKALDKLKKEAEAHDTKMVELEKEIQEYTETDSHLQEEYEEKKRSSGATSTQEEVALTEEQETEYERVREAAAIASAKPRQVLGTAIRKLENARVKASSLNEESKELTTRKNDATTKVTELTERKTKLEESIEKTKSELQTSKQELKSVQQSAKKAQEQRTKIDSELEDINRKLRDARDDRRKNQTETRLLEAIAALKRYFPGVQGRLADLCRPTQRRYNMAVTVAGGKDMDAVVVDTKQTAFDCIQHLRNNQIGTATFLPLDSLQIPNPASTERIRATLEQDGRYRLACDVIHCDENIKPAIMYAVGNTVVCDDLDTARELCFNSENRSQNAEARYKAVTLGGAVISKAGTMTGGVTSDESSKAGRWADREVEKLRERKDELETERVELDNIQDDDAERPGHRTSRGGHTPRIEELQNAVGGLNNRLQYSKSELDFTKKQLKEVEVLVSSLTSQADNIESKVEDANAQVESIQASVEEAGTAVKEAEEEHYGPFREATGMRDIQAYDAALGKAREAYLKKRRVIREHLEKLKAQKEYEEGRDFQEAIKKKEKSVEDVELKLDEAKKREDETKAVEGEANAKLANVTSELEEAQENEKKHEDAAKDIQMEYKEFQNEKRRLGKAITTEESNLERLRSRLHETLQKSRVEEVDIPLIGESSGTAKVDSRSSRAMRRSRGSEASQEDSDEEMSEDQEFSEPLTQMSTHFSQADDTRVVKDRNDAEEIDFSQLRRQLKERLSDREERKVTKDFEDKLEKLVSQIGGMTPNMKAGEAFDSVLDRLEESNDDFTKSKDLFTTTRNEFHDVKKKRAERFNRAFRHIDKALKTIYKDMTTSSKHPLGGEAYLSLDDSEEPFKGGIHFNAMPAGKRFRDMERLSGGEKTVAALALLFAIHSYRPAPFFVMDEVDAALDNVNVRKLCNYIRQRSDDFQCIVISLKDLFYERSRSLVGICRDVATNSSQTLTLDLTKFDQEGEDDDATTRTSQKRKSTLSVASRKSQKQ